MIPVLLRFLQKNSIKSALKDNLHFVEVSNQEEATAIMQSFLSSELDKSTVLFLSGGKTPQNLYKNISISNPFRAGAAGLIDERYGEKMHQNSNEKLLQDTGLLQYFEYTNTAFYPILERKSIEETAQDYDETARFLLTNFQKSVGLLGIGTDGHTAGIAPNRPDFTNPFFLDSQKNKVVSWFNDENGPFGKRVTFTFLGLSLIDIFIVLVLGEEKRFALEKMFTEGTEEEIPARFFLRQEVAEKTLFITDQKI